MCWWACAYVHRYKELAHVMVYNSAQQIQERTQKTYSITTHMSILKRNASCAHTNTCIPEWQDQPGNHESLLTKHLLKTVLRGCAGVYMQKFDTHTILIHKFLRIHKEAYLCACVYIHTHTCAHTHTHKSCIASYMHRHSTLACCDKWAGVVAARYKYYTTIHSHTNLFGCRGVVSFPWSLDGFPFACMIHIDFSILCLVYHHTRATVNVRRMESVMREKKVVVSSWECKDECCSLLLKPNYTCILDQFVLSLSLLCVCLLPNLSLVPFFLLLNPLPASFLTIRALVQLLQRVLPGQESSWGDLCPICAFIQRQEKVVVFSGVEARLLVVIFVHCLWLRANMRMYVNISRSQRSCIELGIMTRAEDDSIHAYLCNCVCMHARVHMHTHTHTHTPWHAYAHAHAYSLTYMHLESTVEFLDTRNTTRMFSVPLSSRNNVATW